MLKKFTSLDLREISNKCKEIPRKKGNVDPKKTEEFVRSIPVFTIAEIINFSAYCLSNLTIKEISEWKEKELEEYLIKWLKKIN